MNIVPGPLVTGKIFIPQKTVYPKLGNKIIQRRIYIFFPALVLLKSEYKNGLCIEPDLRLHPCILKPTSAI